MYSSLKYTFHAYAAQFSREVVDAREHEELWVSAGQLEEFNAHIEGPIEAIGVFVHPSAMGSVPRAGSMRAMSYTEQLDWFAERDDDEMSEAMRASPEHIWLNWPLWRSTEERGGTLDRLRRAWERAECGWTLPEFDVVWEG